jgi:pSer/pThr/pTyr-binding forkhead associated (FHA) protein
VGHRSARHPRLVVTQGHLQGKVIELAADDLVIGRHADSDIVLDTPYVSRSHLRVRQDAMGTWVTDLRTIGGTLVNGARIRGDTLLCEGDEVDIGGLTLTYHAAQTPAAERAHSL